MKKILAVITAFLTIQGMIVPSYSSALNISSDSVVTAPLSGTYNGFSYEEYDGYIEITGYSGTNTSVVVPEEINGLPVTALADCAKIDDAIFPDSVTRITLPSGLERIGRLAFYGTKITSIEIPDTVTSLGDYSFYNCDNLTSIVIPGNVTSIGGKIFSDCNSLTSVTVEEGAETILGYAFENCTQLKFVSLPDTLTKLWSCAFYGCSSLESITLPDSITELGGGMFYGCESLTDVTLPSGVNYLTSFDSAGFFEGCSSLTSYVIPDSVIAIESDTFEGVELESITIGASMVDAEYVFGDFGSLKEFIVVPENSNYCSIDGVLFDKKGVTLLQYPMSKPDADYSIPEKVEVINDYAFAYNSNLKSVSIPYFVNTMGEGAFSYCTALETITFNNKNCEIYDSKYTIYSNAVIQGYQGSTAQAYATEYDRTFVEIPEPEEEPTTEPTEPDPLTLGDINGDGDITVTDAKLILNHYKNISIGLASELTEDQLTAADVNGDTAVDIVDAAQIIDYYSVVASGGLGNFYPADKNAETVIDCGFTPEEIAACTYKPTVSVENVIIDAENISKTANVLISVDAESSIEYCTGFHLIFDERLTLDSITSNSAYVDCLTNEIGEGEAFVTLTGYLDLFYEPTATPLKLTFTLPEDAAEDDVYPIAIEYRSGDVFTNLENDETGRLMQAYLFTSGLQAGAISIQGAVPVPVSYNYTVKMKEPQFYYSHITAPFNAVDLIESITRYTAYDDGSVGTEMEVLTDFSAVTFSGYSPADIYTADKINYTLTASITDEFGTQELADTAVYIGSKGDVNLDGVSDAKDAAAVLIYAAETGSGNNSYLYSESDTKAEQFVYFLADINGESKDGGLTDTEGNASSVDAKDAASILIYAAAAGSGNNISWAEVVKTGWKLAYLQEIEEFETEYASDSDLVYALYYIDADSIPELYMLSRTTGISKLCTYYDENVVCFSESASVKDNSFMGYIERTGIFWTHGIGGYENWVHNIFILEYAAVEITDSFYYNEGTYSRQDADGTMVSITEDEYDQQFGQYTNNETLNNMRFTYDEIISLLQ